MLQSKHLFLVCFCFGGGSVFYKKILHLPVFKQDWVDAVKGTVDLLPALGTGQDHLAGNEYEQHNFERRDHPPD